LLLDINKIKIKNNKIFSPLSCHCRNMTRRTYLENGKKTKKREKERERGGGREGENGRRRGEARRERRKEEGGERRGERGEEEKEEEKEKEKKRKTYLYKTRYVMARERSSIVFENKNSIK